MWDSRCAAMLGVSSITTEADMSRSHPTARAYALGAVFNTAAVATYFGVLVAWSRYCEAHKHRA